MGNLGDGQQEGFGSMLRIPFLRIDLHICRVEYNDSMRKCGLVERLFHGGKCPIDQL
jgi:hypothetical protein